MISFSAVIVLIIGVHLTTAKIHQEVASSPSYILPLTKNDIPISQVDCKGDIPEQRRCLLENVFVSQGVILVVSETPLLTAPPHVLCSAVTKTKHFAKYCEFEVVSRTEIYDKIRGYGNHKSSSRMTTGNRNMNVINITSALAFGRLARANCYHSLFEDLIPIYETLLLYPKLFAHWLNMQPSHHSDNKHQHSQQFRDMIVFVGDDVRDYSTNYYSFMFWKRFFPQVLLTDKYAKSDEFFAVKNLVVGSNSSCIHYFHCSRDTYTTPNIAMSFRQFILSNVGISMREQAMNDAFKPMIRSRNQTLSTSSDDYTVKEEASTKIKPDIVTIIQRNLRESRHIFNIEEVKSTCNLVFGSEFDDRGEKGPCVVKYYSEMSLDEQIIQTYNSDVLICVHGGALGNVLFAKNRSTIIDIYPYSFPTFHGLMNWIRFSLSDSLLLGHSPFEITTPHDMYFRVRSTLTTLPLCLCNTSTTYTWFKCGFGKIFYLCAGLAVNHGEFSDHLRQSLRIWEQRQMTPFSPSMIDQPPVSSKRLFRNLSLARKEPHYYSHVREAYLVSLPAQLNESVRAAANPPDCSTLEFFQPARGKKRKKGLQ